jgi:hypothetical protein
VQIKSDRKSQTGGKDMRVIEQEIIQALRNRKDFSTSITEDMYRKKEGRRDVIEWHKDFPGVFVYNLWGHQIAKGDTYAKVIEVSDCGYATSTTKSRLNAVFAAFDIPVSCSVHRKIMQWYVNGMLSSGLGAQILKAGEWTVRIS